MFIITLYDHDHDRTINETTADTLSEARKIAARYARQLIGNQSVKIFTE